MCGIAGIVRFDGAPVERATLEGMAEVIRHRGPDDLGVYVSPDARAGFSFRRLSIIDLAGGQQPLANQRGDIWIVFNGEIYNYRTLRDELRHKGYVFRTDSDTETIVHAYEEWGVRCVDHLRGMFAFAIWDERQRQLFIARDRVGKKPLYFYCDGSKLAFASELKALRQVSWVPRDLDLRAVGQYLNFGYVPAPRSILRGVHKLQPAHILVANAESQYTHRYWDLKLDPDQPEPESLDEAVDQTEAALQEAVALRMHADVPLGAFLSGGIDSSLIVAMMARLSSRRVQAFSIGFDEAWFNELPFAQQVAQHLGVDLHATVVKPDVQALLLKLTAHFDEPFADSSMIPTYVVSQKAREHVTVALSGDGGDEVFAGYDHYRVYLQMRQLARVPGLRLAASVAERFLPLAMKGEHVVERMGASPRAQYAATVAQTSARLRSILVRPELKAEILAGPHEALRSIYAAENWRSDQAVAAVQRVDITRGYLPGDILVKVDMASMANSLEVRAPFLDHRLIEQAFQQPARFKIAQGKGKLILRRLAERYLPKSIIERRKHGFAPPMSNWLRTSLRPLIDETMLARDSRIAELFDQNVVRQLVEMHVSGRTDRGSAVFLLLALELWLRSVYA